MTWTDNPEYLRKGMEFEGFTRRLFSDAYFEILFQSDEKGTKVPDFYIRLRDNRYKFWVEAKYRDRPVGDKIDIYRDKPDRLVTLRVFQELMLPETVFLVLGVGGESSSPNDLYCLPVKELAYPSPFSRNLEKWRIDSSPFINYENGSLVK